MWISRLIRSWYYKNKTMHLLRSLVKLMRAWYYKRILRKPRIYLIKSEECLSAFKKLLR